MYLQLNNLLKFIEDKRIINLDFIRMHYLNFNRDTKHNFNNNFDIRYLNPYSSLFTIKDSVKKYDENSNTIPFLNNIIKIKLEEFNYNKDQILELLNKEDKLELIDKLLSFIKEFKNNIIFFTDRNLLVKFKNSDNYKIEFYSEIGKKRIETIIELPSTNEYSRDRYISFYKNSDMNIFNNIISDLENFVEFIEHKLLYFPILSEDKINDIVYNHVYKFIIHLFSLNELYFIYKNTNKIVVLEGVDKVGKSTLSNKILKENYGSNSNMVFPIKMHQNNGEDLLENISKNSKDIDLIERQYLNVLNILNKVSYGVNSNTSYLKFIPTNRENKLDLIVQDRSVLSSIIYYLAEKYQESDIIGETLENLNFLKVYNYMKDYLLNYTHISKYLFAFFGNITILLHGTFENDIKNDNDYFESKGNDFRNKVMTLYHAFYENMKLKSDNYELNDFDRILYLDCNQLNKIDIMDYIDDFTKEVENV